MMMKAMIGMRSMMRRSDSDAAKFNQVAKMEMEVESLGSERVVW